MPKRTPGPMSYPDPYAGKMIKINENRYKHLPYEPSPEALEAWRQQQQAGEDLYNKTYGYGPVSNYEPPPPMPPQMDENTALAKPVEQPWGGSYRPATASRPDNVRRFSNMPGAEQDPTVGYVEEAPQKPPAWLGNDFTPESKERFMQSIIEAKYNGIDWREVDPYQEAAKYDNPDLFPEEFQKRYQKLKIQRENALNLINGMSEEWNKRAAMQERINNRKQIAAEKEKPSLAETKYAGEMNTKSFMAKHNISIDPDTKQIIGPSITAAQAKQAKEEAAKSGLEIYFDVVRGAVGDRKQEIMYRINNILPKGKNATSGSMKPDLSIQAPTASFIPESQLESAREFVLRLGQEAKSKGLTGQALSDYVRQRFVAGKSGTN